MPQRAPTLFETILNMTRTIRAGFESRVQQHQGLTFARARLLVTIGHNEGASQAELAAALGIETPTLKRQLDALEELGLARRKPLPGDARKYAVHLTDTARIEPLLGFRAEVENALIDGIPPEDVATTRRVLARMATNAEHLHRAEGDERDKP